MNAKRIAGRFLCSFHKSLSTIALMLFAAHLVVACGGSDAEIETTDTNKGVKPNLFLSPSEVSVAPGSSIEMQVDIENLPTNDQANGYSISLSVATTNIEIVSRDCTTGTFTASCRRWTITPKANAVPGEYGFEVRAAGTRTPVVAGQAKIRVLVPRRDASAVIAASRSHLVTSDGRLWGSGPNLNGEAGIGFTSVGFDPNVPIVLPERVEPGYVQIGTDTDWQAVVTGERTAIALKRNGTVWAWGANPEIQVTTTESNIPLGSYFHFGFPSEAGRQLMPRQISELGTDVIAISTHTASRFESVSEPDAFWALKRDGTVWAWGGRPGPRYNMRLSQRLEYGASDKPLAVPQAVTADGVETPLNDVIAIAGGTGNTGRGWGVVIRSDGSVWQVGSEDGAGSFLENLFSEGVGPGRAMPRRIGGLTTSRTVAVAVGRSGSTSKSFSLVLQGGGVWGITEDRRSEGLVFRLPTNIVAIDARADDATAIDADGRVWTWRFGVTDPVVVGNLPPMARTAQRAPELVLTSNCLNGGGELWHTRGSRIPNFFNGCPLGETREVRLDKTGEGSVTSEPGGEVVCGSGCTNGETVVIARGAPIIVRATPAPGWYFTGFNSECPGGQPSSSENTTCTAHFVPDPRTGALTIAVSGPGRVTSTPAGIDCGTDCQESYALGTQITLTAVAEPGYRLARWRGGSYLNERDCRDGVVTMNVTGDTLKQCTADFEPIPQLRVAASPNGTVTSEPAGINCGATCAAPFVASTPVTLTATPAAGYRFDGFLETACRRPIALGLDTLCTPVFTSTVTAVLSVLLVGDGRVTSPDGNINCSRTGTTLSGICSYSYPAGTVLTLTALPNQGWGLREWSIDCDGGAVRLDVARVCTATFVPAGWQQVGSPIALAGTKGMSIAVDLSVASAPKTYAATAEQAGAGKVNLIVRRFDTQSQTWTVVGGGPANADEVVSRYVFTPAIAVSIAGTVSVAWAAEEDRIRVKQLSSNGASWITLAENLEVDPAARVFGTQITTSGSHLIVAWIEGSYTSNIVGRMAVKRYVPTQPWTGGLVRPTTESNILAVRLNNEPLGHALLMAVPYSSMGFLSEGPLLVLREGANGTWNDVCAGSLITPTGSASAPNQRFGFGIAQNTPSGTTGAVAVFNNGDAVFVRRCNGAIWVGLDGSATGQVATAAAGGQISALTLVSGEAGGVVLAWSQFAPRTNGGFQSFAQVLVANTLGTAVVPLGTAKAFDPNFIVSQGGLSLTLQSDVSPVLGAVLGNSQSTDVEARVFRYVP
jgi:hypothetical protein